MNDTLVKRLRASSRLLLLAAALALASFSTTHAATLAVPAGYLTIQAAVNAAQNGDTVLIADGTYTGDGNRDIDFGGKSLTVASQNGPAKTIIDCGGYASTDGSGNHRGFYLHSGEKNATISGLTVKNGYEALIYSIPVSGYGGGIYHEDDNDQYGVYDGGTLTLINCTITANTAQGDGGGIFNSYCTITLTDCTLNGNTAFGAGGGGIYNNNSTSGMTTLTNCNISRNVVYGPGNGGGILNANGATTTLTNCTLNGNTTQGEAGGIYNFNASFSSVTTMTGCTVTGNTAGSSGGISNDNSNSGTITLTGCTISGNNATYGGGGGVSNKLGSYFSAGGAIMLTGCTITKNSAAYRGGGVANGNNGGGNKPANCTITLANCTVADNTAPIGAGIYNTDTSSLDSGSTTTLTGCTIIGNIGMGNVPVSGTMPTPSSNSAYGYGGGVYNENYSNNGTITLTNCIVTGNTQSGSGYGGGVFNNNASKGKIALTGCTLTGNTASVSGSGVFNSNSNLGTITLTDCILYGDVGNEASEDSTTYNYNKAIISYCDVQGGYSGAGNINADPLFVNAVSGDFHLTPGSPCLGAGMSAGAPATDADGNLRPNPPSIGAYELPGYSHLLWTNPDGRVILWNVDPAGTFTIAGVYGPYTDGSLNTSWTATALATGPDGLSHILWNNPDGRVILWTVALDGTFTITGVYGPYTDAPDHPNSVWKATALSVGPDNVPHILWTNPDGKAVFWNVQADGTFTIVGAYGPYTDGPGTANWTATALATGPDGLSHILWNNPDGRVILWAVDGGGGFTITGVYGPYNDGAPNTPWAAASISVGPDNVPHLLWTNPDGKALLWNVAADGTFSIPGVYGPYTENGSLRAATSLATGAGGLSHLLWNNPDGRVALWSVSSDGTFNVIGGYGPYNDGSPGTPWAAAVVSAGP